MYKQLSNKEQRAQLELENFEKKSTRKKRKRKNKKHKYNVQHMIIPQFNKNIDYTMDGSVKQLFLNLTKMQITFGKENTLSKYFPNMETDEHGNFFLQIGNSKTMFCAHLDTYSHDYEPVNHVIEGDIIKTDGTTTLGGDDKAGVTIMIKMMEANIPGLYYFFRGEEGVTSPTGTWGSKQALKTRKEFFSNYDKCIAFDRKGNNSIISHQMYSECCDSSFVDTLIDEFKDNGLTYVDDATGMWCDSGVFMDLIPECTNISVGYLNEHTFRETQDIVHLEKLVNACIKIDWDALPVKRDPSVIKYDYDYDYGYGNQNVHSDWDFFDKKSYNKASYKDDLKEYATMEEEFNHVCKTLDLVSYEILNFENFYESEEMYFQNMSTNDFFGLKIIDFDIYISTDETLKEYELIGDLETFIGYVMSGIDETELNDRMNYQINDDDNVEHTQVNNTFTSSQEIAFSEFILSHKPIVYNIISDIEKNRNSEVSSDLWIEIEIEMRNFGIKIDYKINGKNPDDLIDWIYINLNMVKDVVEYEPLLTKFKKLLIATGAKEYYTNEQINVFVKLIDKERDLVNLVINDINANMSPKVSTLVSNKITHSIEFHTNVEPKSGLKKVNSQTFTLFVYDFTEDINTYYK